MRRSAQALPSAFLISTARLSSLAATAIILDVRFLTGVAFVPLEQRSEMRRVHVGSPAADASSRDGIFQIIVRYGFAEQPAAGDLSALLVSLGAERRELSGLAHAGCRLGRCALLGAAQAECQPVTFFVAEEQLVSPSALEWLPVTIFNALLHNTTGRASFLNLPPTATITLRDTVDISRLRGLRDEVSLRGPLEPAPT
jgi:hypothetical protein